MSPRPAQNHFALFDLPARFAIDLDALNQRYRLIQGEVHPDRFASSPPAERLRSMQLATQANTAYQTLKQPTARARYLLQLHDIDTEEERNTAMPADFLMQQLEWREAIEDANEDADIAALDSLLNEIKTTGKQWQQDLQHALDVAQDWPAAAAIVRKLSFTDKLQDEILHAISRHED
ncbi:Fe-S protein assembly co-chaperone HscB [Methylobacillus flagellatus]|uniref:Fe-S protein assembly co-chaperone HscB n=1 Tax=Methylobacillus flagellatus TaxID=405 RepID=UPI0010F6DAFE|nr:Fe-S protein assembly co-chaperone HscB [Methylobacillus flagellatus]